MLQTSYFLYTNGDKAFVLQTAAEQKARDSQKAADDALRQRDEMRKRIGPRNEDYDLAKAEIEKEQKSVDDEITALLAQSNEAINKIQAAGAMASDNKVQAAGASNPELDDAKLKVQQISSSYLTEPNKSYISSMERLKNLLKAMVTLDLEMSRNYAALKKNLEATQSVNQSLPWRSEARVRRRQERTRRRAQKARGGTRRAADQGRSVSDRRIIFAAGDRNRRTPTPSSARTEEDNAKKLRLAQDTLREYRDQLERKETVLDSPDGRLTYVDHYRNEVRTNLDA